MVVYSFKSIQVVPTSSDFIDIVLSKTQRKTPTVIHKHYQISRIRQFYMRKVKFTQQTYHDKLTQILEDFPKLDEIHPFYASLLNVIYDRDHYKLALGQLNAAKQMIDNIAKDYVRLLKYGDSLYRCKQLKKAALGRMCTLMKKQGASLEYLEQVRQHLSRLPSIDPNTRTLLVCGYPNVGKSSFVNTTTRADVDVQPYAFTTKSLFVGHTDYKFQRWQVIDTPGILDHPLEDRNTIEMQSVTALAHLQASILFFIDISEQCGYSIEQQVSLFQSISPLFKNKPLIVILNKIDATSFDELTDENKALLREIENIPGAEVSVKQMSTLKGIGVSEVKSLACDLLSEKRIAVKLKTSNINPNKLHVALPRNFVERPTNIPESVLLARQQEKDDINAPVLTKAQLEQQQQAEDDDMFAEGIIPMMGKREEKDKYLLANDEWKYDKIPEIMDGKNIADFIEVDSDILQKLDQLEREEERMLQQAEEEDQDESDSEDLDSEEEELLQKVREKKHLLRYRLKSGKNNAALPRAKVQKNEAIQSFETKLLQMGHDSNAVDTASSRIRSRSKSKSRPMSTDSRVQQKSLERSRSRERSETPGITDPAQRILARKLEKDSKKKLNILGKAGEADRHIGTKMPKHMFAGKRGSGKTDRR